jgi:carbamoyltransferase
MNILGIHIGHGGHDSSAALVQDGQVVAHVAEERLTRVKHQAGFPYQAIETCLTTSGISPEEIDIIAVPTVESREDLNYFFNLTARQRERASAGKRVAKGILSVARRGGHKPPLYMPRFVVGSSAQVLHIDHHLAHAASAYYTCGSTESQLIVTMDGVGDGTAVALWRGEKGRITRLKHFDTRGSLGWFYGNVTEALGWWHGDGEGKTMGLAPYGDPSRAKGLLDKFYPKFQGGDLVEAHDYGTPFDWNDNGAYQFHFDEAFEIHALVQKYGAEHIAAEAQRVLEEQAAEVIFPWLEREGHRNLCCAGGLFLNVKMNQRIWESGKVDQHNIFPDAGDAGLSVGAALFAYYKANPEAEIRPLEHVYWGPEFSNDEVKSLLDARHLQYRYEEDVSEVTARLLAENKIIAWFQGRMESGPRALGGRSILMSPMRAENKDIINARVKFREGFRPFCPSTLAETAKDYLWSAREERFMITSFDVRADKHQAIPAVVHVDGTVRPQTVNRDVNERYWKLIKAFGDRTGEYVLLNTSLNIKNEPIVCHPREAIRCFYDTGLDYLVLGNFILSK